MIVVPSSENFLKRVADVVLENIRELEDPLQVLKMRVYLPNNRSCCILKDYIISTKEALVLPKILTPFEAMSVDDQIQEITKIIDVLDNDMYITAKFNLASSLFNEIKNLTQEKLPLDVSTTSNQKMISLIRKIQCNIDMSSIEENTRYLEDTDIPCICAGFTYSHAYLLDFLKAAFQSKKHIIIFQGNPDIYGLSHKLLTYIGCDNDKNIDTPRNNKKAIINIVESPNKLDEIKTIATIVRSHIGKKITIIYTDKELIAGVKTYLQKWNINIDDSSGTPFKDTQEATIFLLLLQSIISKFATNETLELLKYATTYDHNDIEKFALQNNKTNFLDITQLFDNSTIVSYLTSMSSIFLSDADLSEQLATFETCFFFILDAAKIESSDIIKRVFEHLNALRPYISSLSEYYALATKIMSMYSVRSPWGYTPDIVALGPLEAQIINSDITIVAGFNDKNWIADSTPCLISEYELLYKDLECRRNNDIYNTLYHAINASEELFFTNAVVSEGAQQKLCRLIYSFLNQAEIDTAKDNGKSWTFVDHISRVASKAPIASPQLDYRPTMFSASDIELLMKNPYAFYAKKVLKLNPLNDILSQDYADRLKGILLHKALELSNSPSPDDMKKNIIINIKNEMEQLGLDKYHFLDWTFKIESIAEYAAKHASGADFIEHSGSIEIKTEEQIIKIKCIADAIIHQGDLVSIIDYKTGSLPTYQDILSLNKPQILVEAIIAAKNGFYGIRDCKINCLMFIQLGASEQSLKAINLLDNKSFHDIDRVIQQSEEKLLSILSEYTIGLKPFIACETDCYGEYNHLTREKEWKDDVNIHFLS